MKAICITALLGGASAALRCEDDRVKYADAAKIKIDKQLKDAAYSKVNAELEENQIPKKELENYKKAVNSLTVAVVSSKYYQVKVDAANDEQAKKNAINSVGTAMRAMAYEQGKTGAKDIQKAMKKVSEAGKVFKVAQVKQKEITEEVSRAEKACKPGEPGDPAPPISKDGGGDGGLPESIPAQISLRAVQKSQICPETCETTEQQYLAFKNLGEKEQWKKNCLYLCEVEEDLIDPSIIDKLAEEQEKANIVAVDPVTGKPKTDTKAKQLTKKDIIKQYQLDPKTTNLTFACRNKNGTPECFDSNGQQVEIAVKKGAQSLQETMKPKTTTKTQKGNSTTCNAYDKILGLCKSGIRSFGSYTGAMIAFSATVIYISSEQS